MPHHIRLLIKRNVLKHIASKYIQYVIWPPQHPNMFVDAAEIIRAPRRTWMENSGKRYFALCVNTDGKTGEGETAEHWQSW